LFNKTNCSPNLTPPLFFFFNLVGCKLININFHLNSIVGLIIQDWWGQSIVSQKIVNRTTYDLSVDGFPTKCTTVSQRSPDFSFFSFKQYAKVFISETA